MQKHGWKNVLEPTVVDVAPLKEKALIAFRDRLPWQPIKNIGKLIEPIFHIPFFFILKWFVATWPSMMDGWWMSSRLTQLLESIPTPGLPRVAEQRLWTLKKVKSLMRGWRRASSFKKTAGKHERFFQLLLKITDAKNGQDEGRRLWYLATVSFSDESD